MRSPRNRRLTRFNRKYDKRVYVNSANKIQNQCRHYLKNRYSGMCKNSDDDDIFTFEPVYLIPRSLLQVVEGHAFNSLDLLIWIMKKTERFQFHPITRNELTEEHEITSVLNIAVFSAENDKKFKKGFYKRKKKSNKVLTQYAKINNLCD